MLFSCPKGGEGLATIRSLGIRVYLDLSKFDKSMKVMQGKLNRLGSTLTNIGGTLTTAIALPLAAIGGIAVKTASDFEQSMANAASVSGATGEEFERMTALAREMGKTTVFSASESADAMYYMASAGYKVEQMENSLNEVLDLASATQRDLAFTTDTVISTLSQFGLESSDAGRVTNVFASAIGNSQATLDKLANSMRYVGPVANSLGYSLEETTGALAIFYNAGYQGEQAGTMLRTALSRLAKPTKEINQTLTELGLTFDDVNPATNKFDDIIRKLEKSGLSTAQAIALFGQEAGPGMIAVVGKGGDAVSDMTEKITNTTAAADMAARQLETFQGSIKMLQSQAEEVAITIGNILIPKLSALMKNHIMPLIEKFNGLSDKTKNLIVNIALMAGAIGPAIFILGKLSKVMAAVIGVLRLPTSPLTAKIALVVGAIALAVAIFTKLYNSSETFRGAVDRIMAVLGQLASTLSGVFATVMELVTTAFELIMPIIEIIGTFIFEKIAKALEFLMPIIEKVATAFNFLFGGIVKLLSGDVSGALSDFKNFFINIFDAISMYFKGCLNFWINGINGFLNVIGSGINWVVKSLNKIQISIPDWVPIFGGESWGFNLSEVSMPQIPQLANGGVIPPNSEFLAILGDQKSGTNIEAPLDTIVDAFKIANHDNARNTKTQNGKTEVVVRFEGLSENAFISMLTPKIISKAKNTGLI